MTARRDVVLISVDTLRYDAVGACPAKPHLRARGCENLADTPNLDAFLAESAYFTQCITTAPYTTAAHASVLSGLYPNRHGVRAFYKWGLADGVGTLAEELKGHGYVTCAVQEAGGDTALSTGSGVLRGFDRLFRDEGEAVAWCTRQEQPRLLFVHTFDVHVPYCWSAVPYSRERAWAWQEQMCKLRQRLGGWIDEGPADRTRFCSWIAERAARRIGAEQTGRLMLEWYLRGVRWFDTVRWPRIVATLQDAGLLETALTAVFADHGESLAPDSTGPPFGHGNSLLDDVIRVPLALRGPGIEPARRHEPVSLVDIAPTALQWLGLRPRLLGEAGACQGASLLDAPGRDVCFAEVWRSLNPPRTDTDGRNWLRHLHGHCEPSQVAGRSPRCKVIWQPGEPGLRRFMEPAARAGVGLRRALKRVLPRPAVRALQRLRYRQREAAGTPTTATSDAATFVLELAEDPLEEHPVRTSPDDLDTLSRRLYEGLQHYWSEGRTGPAIKLGEGQNERVMHHLRDLGYVD